MMFSQLNVLYAFLAYKHFQLVLGSLGVLITSYRTSLLISWNWDKF